MASIFDSIGNWMNGGQDIAYSPFAAQTMAMNNPGAYQDYMGQFNISGKNDNNLFGEGDFFGKDGGFGSLMGFGKDAFNIYGGMQKLDMMQNMFDEQSKYAATNLYNQGVMLDEGREKQRATLSGNWAPGQAPKRGFLDSPEKIKRTV